MTSSLFFWKYSVIDRHFAAISRRDAVWASLDTRRRAVAGIRFTKLLTSAINPSDDIDISGMRGIILNVNRLPISSNPDHHYRSRSRSAQNRKSLKGVHAWPQPICQCDKVASSFSAWTNRRIPDIKAQFANSQLLKVRNCADFYLHPQNINCVIHSWAVSMLTVLYQLRSAKDP